MNKTTLLRFSLILSPALSMNSYAQTDSLGWSYFPFRTGDQWECFVVGGGDVDTFRITNIRDSIGVDGHQYLIQYQRLINPLGWEYYQNYIVDTAKAEVREPLTTGDPPQTTWIPRYRFNVQQGDKWVMYSYQIAGYEMARVMGIYDGVLFNRITTFMDIKYYEARDSTDTLGLDRYVATLARGFGLVLQGGGDMFDTYYIRGSVINGILYGDTARIVTSVSDDFAEGLPRNLQLYQNYPNPFNPSTHIRFQLHQQGLVKLAIYDLLGREVRQLVDEEKQSGEYVAVWDGRDDRGQSVSSGIYLYRFVAGNTILTRKMVHLK
jgi:hypothetical protein